MTRRTLSSWMILLVLLGGASRAEAGPEKEDASPPFADLFLHFDFEQDIDGDHFPDEWSPKPVRGRWHPQNIRVQLDAAEHRDGKHALLMELDGVTNVYETTRTYRFDPRFSYRLSGCVKTSGVASSGLRKTSARIELVGLDPDGDTVVFRASTPGVMGTSDWTRLSVDVPRDGRPSFRLVRIRCVTDGLAIGGKVWFDRITFAPRPNARISAGTPDGFFYGGGSAKASVSLDTLIGNAYGLSAQLSDPGGRTVMNRKLKVTPGEGLGARAEFGLPLETFGVHRLTVELSVRGKSVLSASKWLLNRPGPAGGRTSKVWGIAAGRLDRLSPDRTDMLLGSSFGTVAFDLFGTEGTPAQPHEAAREFARLREHHAEPVVVLGHLPSTVIGRLYRDRHVMSVGQAGWLHTLSLDGKYWSSELTEAARPVAGRTTYWQIGLSSGAVVPPDELVRAVKQLRETLAQMTYRPRIGVALDGTEDKSLIAAAGVCDFVVLARPARKDSEQELAAVISRLKPQISEVWVSVTAENPAEGMIRARAAGADRVIVALARDPLQDPAGESLRALSAAATVAREIAGKPFAGRLKTKTPAFLFAGPSGARLAVIPDPDIRYELAGLGDGPRKIDLGGNVSPVGLWLGDAVFETAGRPYLIDGLDVEALPRQHSLSTSAEN